MGCTILSKCKEPIAPRELGCLGCSSSQGTRTQPAFTGTPRRLSAVFISGTQTPAPQELPKNTRKNPTIHLGTHNRHPAPESDFSLGSPPRRVDAPRVPTRNISPSFIPLPAPGAPGGHPRGSATGAQRPSCPPEMPPPTTTTSHFSAMALPPGPAAPLPPCGGGGVSRPAAVGGQHRPAPHRTAPGEGWIQLSLAYLPQGEGREAPGVEERSPKAVVIVGLLVLLRLCWGLGPRHLLNAPGPPVGTCGSQRWSCRLWKTCRIK